MIALAAEPAGIAVDAAAASARPAHPTVSVVVPAYDEQDGLAPLLARLHEVLDPTRCPWELVLVDDGSRDATVARARELRAGDPRLRLVRLARNFGKEAALVAGLREARGQVVVPMDADLQDDPAAIPRMLHHWRAGSDVVLGIKSRRDEGSFKRWSSTAFHALLRLLGGPGAEPGSGEFRLMDRAVLDDFLRLGETQRWNKGLLAWVARNQAVVHFARPARRHGQSKFRLGRMLAHAADGITAMSIAPLRLFLLLGGAGMALVAGWWLLTLVRIFVLGHAAALGYASVISAVVVMGSINLIGLGIVGEYVGRSFMQAKGRPLYLQAGVEGDAAEAFAVGAER
jgi:polyisoprenyl-phosphate glycosyltransferase